MLRIVMPLVASFCLVAEAQAQADYPSRPVRVIVNSAPGGGTDILTRVLTNNFQKPRANNSSWKTAAGRPGRSGWKRPRVPNPTATR